MIIYNEQLSSSVLSVLSYAQGTNFQQQGQLSLLSIL